MVDKEEDAKKKREALALRIGHTKAGHQWLRRVNQIGKGGDPIGIIQEDEEGRRGIEEDA